MDKYLQNRGINVVDVSKLFYFTTVLSDELIDELIIDTEKILQNKSSISYDSYLAGKIDDGKYKDFLQDEVTNNTGPYHSILDNPSKGLDFPISEDGKSVINEIMDNCLEKIAEQQNGLEIIDTINQKILDHGMKNNLNETPEKIALDKLFATEHKDKGFTRWCCRMALLGTTDIPLS